jgi:hypothetical protein
VRPSSAKAKGRRLQQEVVAAILAAFPHLQPDDVTSRSMGAGGTDVLLSPAAKHFFPFAVECKNVEAVNIWAALDQAQAHVPPQGALLHPLVVFKRNKSETYAALPFDTLLNLVREAAAGTLL